MPSFKVRRKILGLGGLQLGTNASSMNDLFFGSVNIVAPSAIADAVVVASAAIAGVAAGDTLIATPAGSLTANMTMISACAISGGVSASFLNSSSSNAAASSTVPLNYVIFS